MLGRLVQNPWTLVCALLVVTVASFLAILPMGTRAIAALSEEGLRAITVKPSFLTFNGIGDIAQLEVEGVYTDGQIRPLPSSLRTSVAFTSDSQGVALVSPQGIVRATANGGTDIRVRVRDFSARVPVIVATPLASIPMPNPDKMLPLDSEGVAVILNRVLLFGVSGTTEADFNDVASQVGGTILAVFPRLEGSLIETNADTPEDALDILTRLADDPRLIAAIPDTVFPPAKHDIDTLLLSPRAQKAYTDIGLKAAWMSMEQYLALPSPVTVAIIDTAIDMKAGNDEFDPNHVVPQEMIEDAKLLSASKRKARAGHGTAVTSVIAAKNNEKSSDFDYQLSGILSSVPHLPYRVLMYQASVEASDGSWRFEDSAIYAAMDDILGKKGQIDVVNMSLGSTCSFPDMLPVLKQLMELGCKARNYLNKKKLAPLIEEASNTVFVVAAGNEDAEANLAWPASMSSSPNVFTIGATDENSRSVWNAAAHAASNYGAAITLGAPGTDAWTLTPYERTGSADETRRWAYRGNNGTSFSAPIVAGVVGLLRSIAPASPSEDIKALLQATARNIVVCTEDKPIYSSIPGVTCAQDKRETWPLVQADAAVEKALRDAGFLFDRVGLVGAVAGKFSTVNGSFRLSVSPRDATGRLVQSGFTESSFVFKEVTAAKQDAPDIVVSRPTVRVVDLDVIGGQASAAKTIALLFDSSGSMGRNDASRLRVEAGKKLLALKKEGDSGMVLDFGAGKTSGLRAARVLQGLTEESAALTAAVDKVSQSGNTPLFDGLMDTLDQLAAGSTGEAAIVVLTDGVENDSDHTFSDVVAYAQSKQIPIFTIGLGSGIDFTQLQNLAGETGGTFAEAANAEALDSVFRAIGLGIVEGRVVVTGEGTFLPPLPEAGSFVVSGIVLTSMGTEVFRTPFSLVVKVTESALPRP